VKQARSCWLRWRAHIKFTKYIWQKWCLIWLYWLQITTAAYNVLQIRCDFCWLSVVEPQVRLELGSSKLLKSGSSSARQANKPILNQAFSESNSMDSRASSFFDSPTDRTAIQPWLFGSTTVSSRLYRRPHHHHYRHLFLNAPTPPLLGPVNIGTKAPTLATPEPYTLPQKPKTTKLSPPPPTTRHTSRRRPLHPQRGRETHHHWWIHIHYKKLFNLWRILRDVFRKSRMCIAAQNTVTIC
jgi:hypothetical protein